MKENENAKTGEKENKELTEAQATTVTGGSTLKLDEIKLEEATAKVLVENTGLPGLTVTGLPSGMTYNDPTQPVPDEE